MLILTVRLSKPTKLCYQLHYNHYGLSLYIFPAVNLSISVQKRGEFMLPTNTQYTKPFSKNCRVGIKHFFTVGLMSPGWTRVRTQVRTHSDFCWTRTRDSGPMDSDSHLMDSDSGLMDSDSDSSLVDSDSLLDSLQHCLWPQVVHVLSGLISNKRKYFRRYKGVKILFFTYRVFSLNFWWGRGMAFWGRIVVPIR